MQSKKSSKELINCFKDYIDIADASYALLHNVFENEEGELDRLSKKHGLENLPENTINSCKKEEINNPVWRYKDNGIAIPITVRASYTYVKTKYGLFGDEGRGVKLSKQNFVTRTSRSEFHIINGKFERASKDK